MFFNYQKIKFSYALILIAFVILQYSCNDSKGEISKRQIGYQKVIDSLAEITLNDIRANELDKAVELLRTVKEKSDSLNYNKGIASYYKLDGLISMLKGKNTSAINNYKKAASIFNKEGNYKELAFCITYTAVGYNYKGIVDTAIIFLDSSLSIHKKYDIPNDEIAKNTLANIYFNQKFYEKTISIYRKVAKSFLNNQDTLNYNKSILNLGGAYTLLDQFDSAYTTLNLCKFNKEESISSLAANQMLSLGNLFYTQKRFQEAEEYIKKAIDIYTLNENNLGLDNAMNTLGVLYSDNGKHEKAISAYRKAIAIFGSKEEPIILLGFYDNLASEMADIGRYDSAYYYKKLNGDIRERIFTQESNRSVAEFKAKYNNEKLQKESLLLEKERDAEKYKNKRLNIITFSLLALLIITILLVQLFRLKYISNKLLAAKNLELHKQKLEEMEKEIKIQRMGALMEGQEQERTRIATELHDGLGSLLATVKHHFEAVETKMETNLDMYNKAQHLLDEACSEVRRISHDMASNVLSRFGLPAALQDLAEMVSSSGSIKVQVIISGVNGRLENSIEVNLFRIAQELMGNIIKHSKSTKVSIQLIQHDESINLIIEDNGEGFILNDAKQKGGMGLRNLNARVEHMHGSIEFDTGKGIGTTVIVEVPINDVIV